MRLYSAACFLNLYLVFVCAAQTSGPPRYTDPDEPAERRAADLVSRMTLDEKVLQMQNAAPAIPRLGVPAYDWWNEALHGVARAGDATVFPQAIGLAATFDTDLMHRIGDVISTEARAKYNKAIAENNHSRYFGLTFWSPNINIFRDPRWGRGQETYGEDPWLTGRLAVSFIQGLQGNDPHYFRVIATAKHYAVHSGPEPSRHEFDVAPTPRDLAQTYLPAFHAAITEGKADSVMCAYNRVDGVPACASPALLQQNLRTDWGFQGYVVSDCGAIRDIFAGHKYKPNSAESSAAAVKAGTDLTCGNEYRFLVDAVKQGLITEPEIDRSLERLFVARFRLGMFDPPARVPFAAIPPTEIDSEAHRKVALEAARKSIVLLKNQGAILPLAASVKSIAVIGPSADDPVALLGNYNGFSSREVTPLEGIEKQFAGKAKIRYALGAPYTAQTAAPIPRTAFVPPDGAGSGLLVEYFDNAAFTGQPKSARVEPQPFLGEGLVDPAWSVRWTGSLVAPVTGEYRVATSGVSGGRTGAKVFLEDKELPSSATVSLKAGQSYPIRIDYPSPGSAGTLQVDWLPPAGPLLTEAMDAVKNSDAAILFMGLNPNLEGEEMRVSVPGFKGGDRTDLNLPETQEWLLSAALSAGKPVIVVLTSGSALAANEAAARANAVLELWYGGEETGTAIAETLAGVNNPAGRLPVTFYKNAEQLPLFEDYRMDGRTYRYFKGEALYGFGFGLSYSKFAYSGLRAKRTATGAEISVRVKNTSVREGDEVAQLYLEGPGLPSEAIRQLQGFQRIGLRPGESRDVVFNLGSADIPAGKVSFTVGGGQPGPGITTLRGAF
jgi:beta-glucosidase